MHLLRDYKNISTSFSEISIGISTLTLSTIIGIILRYVFFLNQRVYWVDEDHLYKKSRTSLLLSLFVCVFGTSNIKRLNKSIKIISHFIKIYNKEDMLYEDPMFRLVSVSEELLNDHKIYRRIEVKTYENFFLELSRVLNLLKMNSQKINLVSEFCKGIPKHYISENRGKSFYVYYENWLKANNYNENNYLNGRINLFDRQNKVLPFWLRFISQNNINRYQQNDLSNFLSVFINRELKSLINVSEINIELWKYLFGQEFNLNDNLTSYIDDFPDVPPQKSSSTEVIWNEQERLIISDKTIVPFIDKQLFNDAIRSLRDRISNIAVELNSANCDFRFILFLKEIADKIENLETDQKIMFSFCHDYEVLISYSSTINEEVSPFLSAKYHSMLIQYDNTIKQIPEWTEFQKNLIKDELKFDNNFRIDELESGFLEFVRNSDLNKIIHPEVSENIENQYKELARVKLNDANLLFEKSTRITDYLYSIENVMKSIAVKALEYIETACKNGFKYFADGFNSAVVSSIKNAGKISALSLIIGLPTVIFGQQIILFFTKNFPWFEKVVDFILKYKDIIELLN